MPGYELIGEEERREINEIFDKAGGVLCRRGFDGLRNGVHKVRDFEAAFAKRLRVKHALAVSSGTAAVKVALKTLGIGRGDEVITQCHTFVATVEAILECGATPVLTEIDATLNMDPADLKARINDRTKAIIPVHMLGAPAAMDRIMEIATAARVLVIEDTAQALGGEFRGQALGTIGALGAFSFDHGKAVTTGEAGMVVTNDDTLHNVASAYHDHGHENNPAFSRAHDTRQYGGGFNYRMSELQGAVGLAQLRKLDYSLEKQRQNKARLKAGLTKARSIQFRMITDEKGETGDTLVFSVSSPAACERVARALEHRGIGFKNLPTALKWHFSGEWEHLLPEIEGFRDRDLGRMWPRSGQILRSTIAIPVLIRMDAKQIDETVQSILAALEEAV